MNIKDMFSGKYPDDLDKSEARKKVIKIAWPALVELFLVQLCTLIDNMMVGKLSPTALASVAYCTQPRFLLLCVFVALNSGATAVIARYKGANKREDANEAFAQSMIMAFWLSIILSVIGYIYSERLVVFMGAESELAIRYATQYMQIQMAGFIFNALTLAISAGLRGIGKTKISMYYNLTANVINVILNYLLIYGKFGFPKMEVAGASLATVIGQVVSFIIAAAVVMNKKSYLYVKVKSLIKINIDMCGKILKIGIPAMGEQLMLRFGLIVYTLTVTSLGEKLYATHQTALNIMGLSFMNGQAFGIAATSLLGQSMGYKRPDHGKAYTYECRRYGMIFSIILGIFLVVFNREIMSLFTDDEYIIETGCKLLWIVAINQPIQAGQLIVSGALRGAGDTMTVAVSTFLGMAILRPIGSIIAVKVLGLGIMGAWAAVLIDQVVRSVIVYVRFAGEKWKKIEI
ncbi:MAG: MATE family efflux transporter [Firmicutes bacterium]|nr:MATE family efflux transporter [Bacillota bacterium]